MPVQGSPIAGPLTVDDVRQFLRDYTNNNILLDDVQFSNDDVNKAMSFAVNEYNIIPPITAETADTVPPALLILGTASWLMSSESFLQIRNQATYQDGDVAPIGIDDKHTLYLQFSNNLKEDWKNSAKQYKIAQNMEAAYGWLSSGYRNVGRFRG